MKNKELFPLSRNRYFPGKQLVTRDMEAEQKYFNNKRRLQNRFLHGFGVVSGLTVTAVEQADDTSKKSSVSVAIEPGMAIDGMGREIVVAEQVFLHLSDMEEFYLDDGLSEYVYLMISYEEAEREPMHSVLDTAVAQDYYNRTEEGYRLSLSFTEPPYEKATMTNETVQDIIASHFEENLQEKLERGERAKLCLAKIKLIRWGSAYTIESVENNPLQEVVYSTALTRRLMEHCFASRGIDDDKNNKKETNVSARGGRTADVEVRDGVCIIDIPAAAKAGESYFSEEISHGLGLGEISMTVGLSTDQRNVVYGEADIFMDSLPFAYAYRVDEQNGVFKIGVRLKRSLAEARRILFSWCALRKGDAVQFIAERPYLIITPGMLHISLRETVQFTCKGIGIEDEEVLWTVREDTGGTIDENGYYRAPNAPGVYEIIAQSVSDPKIQTSAFVVVQQL